MFNVANAIKEVSGQIIEWRSDIESSANMNRLIEAVSRNEATLNRIESQVRLIADAPLRTGIAHLDDAAAKSRSVSERQHLVTLARDEFKAGAASGTAVGKPMSALFCALCWLALNQRDDHLRWLAHAKSLVRAELAGILDRRPPMVAGPTFADVVRSTLSATFRENMAQAERDVVQWHLDERRLVEDLAAVEGVVRSLEGKAPDSCAAISMTRWGRPCIGWTLSDSIVERDDVRIAVTGGSFDHNKHTASATLSVLSGSLDLVMPIKLCIDTSDPGSRAIVFDSEVASLAEKSQWRIESLIGTHSLPYLSVVKAVRVALQITPNSFDLVQIPNLKEIGEVYSSYDTSSDWDDGGPFDHRAYHA